MFIKQAFFFCCIAVFFLFTKEARADAIGVSPSSETVTVFQGDTLEKMLILSRSGGDQEISFSVETVGSELIQINGIDTVTIPEGEDSQEFYYTVDASIQDLGKYEGRLVFTLEKAVVQESGSLTTQFQLITTFDIDVIERPNKEHALSIEEYPFLLEEISVEDIAFDQTFFSSKKEVEVSIEVKNEGRNPLSEIPLEVTLYHDGITYGQQRFVISDPIQAGKSFYQKATFVLNDQYASGKYVTEVIVRDQVAQGGVYIIHRTPFLNFFICSMSLFMVVVFLIGRSFLSRNSRRRL